MQVVSHWPWSVQSAVSGEQVGLPPGVRAA
jgi:hypothetical protein